MICPDKIVLLAWVAVVSCACSSGGVGSDGQPDVGADRRGETALEDKLAGMEQRGTDVQGDAADIVGTEAGDGTATPAKGKVEIIPYAPGTCGCPVPLPAAEDPPVTCGWFAGESAVLRIAAEFLPDQGSPELAIDRVELFAIDSETSEKVLLQTAKDPDPASGFYLLPFEADSMPKGGGQFEGKVTEVSLLATAVTVAPGGGQEPFQRTAVINLTIDQVPPVLTIVQPETEVEIATPYLGFLPFEVQASDVGSSLDRLRFVLGDEVFAEIPAAELATTEEGTLVGSVDVGGLGNVKGDLRIVAVDCGGNEGEGTVPVVIVAQPDYLAPDSVACETFAQEDENKLTRLRVGQGDATDSVPDFVAVSEKKVWVAWGVAAQLPGALETVYLGKGIRDAWFEDVTLDGNPDLVVLALNEELGKQAIHILRQHTDEDGYGQRIFVPAPGQSIPLGKDPFRIHVEDMDDDGDPDVLVGHKSEEESVAVLWHTGKSELDDPLDTPETYLEPLEFLTGVGGVSGMAVGDVDDNGLPDIVISRVAKGIVSTYLNPGETYSMAHDTIVFGDNVEQVGLGDFDNDGLLDAVMFVQDQMVAYQMSNVGGGYFDPTILGGAGCTKYLPALAASSCFGGEGGTVHKAGKLVWAGLDSDALVVADFNLDGNLDLVLSEEKMGIIQLYYGLGDGTFAEALFLNGGTGPHSLVAGFFNADEILDLAAITGVECGIRFYLSNSVGSFGQPGGDLPALKSQAEIPNPIPGLLRWNTPAEVPMPGSHECKKGRFDPTHIVTGDFDNNGHADLVVGSPVAKAPFGLDFNDNDILSDTHLIVTLPGLAEPDMPMTMVHSTAAYKFNAKLLSLEKGEFNGDGYLDLLVAVESKGTCTSWSESNDKDKCKSVASLDVLLGNSRPEWGFCDTAVSCKTAPCVKGLTGPAPGSFTPLGGYPLELFIQDAAAAPLDKHPQSDIISVFKEQGTPGQDSYLPQAVEALLVRPSGAGQTCGVDFPVPLVAGVCPRGVGTGEQSDVASSCVTTGASAGALADGIEGAVVGEKPVAVVTYDLDKDGALDVISANKASNDLAIIRGVSGPDEYEMDTKAKPIKLLSVGSEPLDLDVGDVDGDGWGDIVCVLKDKVAISWGIDGSSFAVPLYIAKTPSCGAFQPSRVLVSDVNADGRADVAILSSNSSKLFFYVSVGQKHLVGPFIFPTALGPIDLETTDVNKDGCRDLLVANAGAGTVTILINEYCKLPGM